jgi:HEPN domain-containing protein
MMLDHREFDRWREAANVARRGAEVQRDARLYNWSCFLAEQSAQLAVKGLLHGIGSGAWGHDLVQLGENVAAAMNEPTPPPMEAALRRLSRHYIPARYPDAHPGGSPGAYYGATDAEQALSDLDEVLRFIDVRWARLRDAAEGA